MPLPPTPSGATVYLLRSLSKPDQPYVGLTRGPIQDRLRRHNKGHVRSTVRHRPWQLHATFWFADEGTATTFERYLKSGSGRAFARRHFETS